MDKRVLVTGGAGFIGGALIDRLLETANTRIVCVDKLTYAGNRERLTAQIARGLEFHRVDLADSKAMHEIVAGLEPNTVFHLAAESHVDRSIDGPAPFVATNILGTSNLLMACQELTSGIDARPGRNFRLIHVSTDEVFGSAREGEHFDETTPYRPNSPYAASKAAAEHLVSAWHHTFSLPAVVTNCSNNYGPYQFPEKLIPHAIVRALAGHEIPIYGDGLHERDWIYVEDHVDGLLRAAERGLPGKHYFFGARTVVTNLELVRRLCRILDELAPEATSYADRIALVPDRPGHDRRYSIDPSKTEEALDWSATIALDSGLRKTVVWYLENQDWWRGILKSGYTVTRVGLNG
jgi:dTDP-glucose 4,6-dehydratase